MRLSHIFNPKSLLLAGGLAIGAAQGIPAQAETLPVQTEQSAPGMQRLFADMRRTDLGTQLLDFAAANHIGILYDAKLATINNFAQYLPETSTISIRPDLSAEEQVLYLAHELRHAWQDKVLGFGALDARRLMPEQRVVLQRFVEADAHAFSALFWADRMMQLGAAPVAQHAGFELSLAHELAAAMKDGQVATADYARIAVIPYFDHLADYNDRHVAMAAKATDSLRAAVKASLEPGGQGLKALQAEVMDAPGDKEFVTWLRQLGGTGFGTGDSGAFNGIKDHQLLTTLPLHDLDGHDLMPALGSASVVMPGPRQRLERLQKIDATQRQKLFETAMPATQPAPRLTVGP